MFGKIWRRPAWRIDRGARGRFNGHRGGARRVVPAKGEGRSEQVRRTAVPLACVLAVFTLSAAFTAPGFIPRYYVLHQDGLVLAGLVVLLLLFRVRATPNSVPQIPAFQLSMGRLVIGVAVAALLLWGATYLLFDN